MRGCSEIFEVTWDPDSSEPFGGRRLIARAFVAFGDPVPLRRWKRRGGKGENRDGGTISGRVVKRSARSRVK